MHIVCCMVSQGGADLQGRRGGRGNLHAAYYMHTIRATVYMYVCAVCEYICI